MTQIDITIVYLTHRPGGIDMLAESLRHQIPTYELVVIDGYPGRVERGVAKQYLLDAGVRLAHYGKPKPRSYPGSATGFANAMNTGALWVRSPYVVFLHDFTYMLPGAISQWMVCRRLHPARSLISGIASMRDVQPPEDTTDLSLWGDPSVCLRNLYNETERWVPRKFELFYAGFPIDFITLINGFDERADTGHINWTYASVIHQAEAHGYSLRVDSRLEVVMGNHRKWGESESDSPDSGNSKLWYPAREPEAKVKRPEWLPTSPNPYTFRNLRKMYIELDRLF